MTNATMTVIHQGSVFEGGEGARTINSLTSYSHDIELVGGFMSANVSFVAPMHEFSFWRDKGVGRHVQVIGRQGGTVFEGVVEKVGIGYGAESVDIGDLFDLSNRVRVDYRTITWNTNPPVRGVAASTTWVEDIASQTIFGILETVVSGGEGDQDEMELLRDTTLAQKSYPTRAGSVNTSDGSQLTITLDVAGYQKYLERYNYEQIVDSGKEDMSLAIQRVLNASPNISHVPNMALSYFAYAGIDVPVWQDSPRGAWETIKDIVAKGGEQKFTCGIFANRKFVFMPVSSPIENGKVLSHVFGTTVFRQGGTVVLPEYIVPGDYVLSSEPSGSRKPFLVEKVSFSESGVTLNYESRSIRQALIDAGLGGM